MGQWLEDVSGQKRRIRRSLTLGSTSTLTKSEARRMLRDHIAKLGINTGEFLERSVNPVTVFTFTQAADRYEVGRLQDLKPSTRRTNEYHLRRYLRPAFGKTSTESLTIDVVNGVVRTWASEGLSRNTMRNLVNTLRSVTGKDFEDVKYPSQVQITDDEEPCFAPEQMAKIIVAARNAQMRAFFATAAGTGMRSGELCGLRMQDVDLSKGIISIRRSAWEGKEQTPKTRSAVRKIGIDASLVRILREHIGQREVGYVFQARNGQPLRESNIIRRELHPVLKTLGIPKCGLHAFRHGRVSFLVENNVPLPMIRLWIGHGSDKMVARYTHARPEFHANVIASLPTIVVNTEAAAA